MRAPSWVRTGLRCLPRASPFKTPAASTPTPLKPMTRAGSSFPCSSPASTMLAHIRTVSGPNGNTTLRFTEGSRQKSNFRCPGKNLRKKRLCTGLQESLLHTEYCYLSTRVAGSFEPLLQHKPNLNNEAAGWGAALRGRRLREGPGTLPNPSTPTCWRPLPYPPVSRVGRSREENPL